MDIMRLITDQIANQSTVDKLSKESGAEPDKVQNLVKMAMPTLLQAINGNTNTKEGSESLSRALKEHENDRVEEPEKFLENVNKEEGNKMLGHIFSEKDGQVKEKLAAESGLDTKQVATVLSMLAPLLIGALGRQKREKGLDESGISGLVGSLLNTQSRSGIMSLLDFNKDGNIADDVSGVIGKFLKK